MAAKREGYCGGLVCCCQHKPATATAASLMLPAMGPVVMTVALASLMMAEQEPGNRAAVTKVAADDGHTVGVWDSVTGQESLTFKGRTGDFTSVAFSPDGKRLVAGLWDGTVKVWDATSGKELLTMKGHSEKVSSLAFSPDGKRLASSCFDKTVSVWDAATGQQLLSIITVNTGIAESLAFSPDGARLAAAGGDRLFGDNTKVTVWDATTGQELLTIKPNAA